MTALTVEIVSWNASVWDGEATHVSVPGQEGRLGVLPGHQPLVAILGHGAIHVDPVNGPRTSIPTYGGIVFVDANQVTILLDDRPIGPHEARSGVRPER